MGEKSEKERKERRKKEKKEKKEITWRKVILCSGANSLT